MRMNKKTILKLPFEDRIQAGRLLGEALDRYANRDDVIILALPRAVFQWIRGRPDDQRAADIMLVRKLGTPGQEELAMGAIASGGVCVLNDDIVAALDVTKEEIEAAATRERKELERRERAYRGTSPLPRLKIIA